MNVLKPNVTKYVGKTVKDVLRDLGLSARVISRLKNNEQGILLDGARVTVRAVIKEGSVLTLNFGDDETSFTPEQQPLTVLYEDEFVAVFDKPAGMHTHPSKAIQHGTLANAAVHHFQCRGEKITFRAVNRLDSGTSGAVVCAKDAHSARIIASSMSKVYLCICHGEIPESGRFDGNIGLADGSIIKRCVREDGQTAVTDFVRVAGGGDCSAAAVLLQTGRTHQIRVHFSSAGHPLVGDTLYGSGDDDIARQALHCAAVAFELPNGRRLAATCAVPDDIERLANKHNFCLPDDALLNQLLQRQK